MTTKEEISQLMKRMDKVEVALFGDDTQKGQYEMTKEMYEIIVVTRGVATFIKWIAATVMAAVSLFGLLKGLGTIK